MSKITINDDVLVKGNVFGYIKTMSGDISTMSVIL